jgi:hypothetical protein
LAPSSYLHGIGGSALLLLVLFTTACASRPEKTSPTVPIPTPATFKAIDEQTLADQPAETQATFRAAYGEGAAEAWNLAHNQAALQIMDARAILQASPNPVSTRAWAGTTTITFATGSDAAGQVFVSINGGPEKLFATASIGSQEADWIWRGSTYEFRLYGGTHREQLLRSLTVTRANTVAATLGPGSAVMPIVLLVAGLVARWTSRPRLATLLTATFAVMTTALVLWVVLSAEPRTLGQQPFPDSHEYADAARHLAAGDGYVTTVHDNLAQPPRYPPGLSLVLVPFAVFGGTYPGSILAATHWLGVVYVLGAAATAWLVGGPIAAGLAAALVGTAPFAIESASLVMADALVTAITVLVAGLLQRRTLAPAAVAAVLTGVLALLRLSALAAVPALVLALPKGRLRRAAAYLVPGIVALAVFQWTAFGSPLRTGYDYWLPNLRMFDAEYALRRPMGDTPTMVGDMLNGQLLGWLCPCPDEGGPLTRLPNVAFYPAVIFGPFWIFAPPLVGLVGFVYALLHWREPAARFSVWLTLLTCSVLAVYVFQAARLAAAPAVLLAVYAAVAAARWLEHGARSAPGQCRSALATAPDTPATCRAASARKRPD